MSDDDLAADLDHLTAELDRVWQDLDATLVRVRARTDDPALWIPIGRAADHLRELLPLAESAAERAMWAGLEAADEGGP
jgi:hypothetical protein